VVSSRLQKTNTQKLETKIMQTALKKPLINAQTLHYFNAISAITSYHLFAKTSANDEVELLARAGVPSFIAAEVDEAVTTLNFTYHVAKRMQQLSITEAEVLLLVEAGVKRYHSGTCSYSLTPAICKRLLQDQVLSAQAMDKVKNKYVVLGDDGATVVTAGYRTVRFKNKRNKRVKRFKDKSERWFTSF
jgi:hypothetical protein